ncbi:unnamed protein product [Prunus brigantina]
MICFGVTLNECHAVQCSCIACVTIGDATPPFQDREALGFLLFFWFFFFFFFFFLRAGLWSSTLSFSLSALVQNFLCQGQKLGNFIGNID